MHHTIMRPAFLSPPSEYYTDVEGAAGGVTRAMPPIKGDATRNPLTARPAPPPPLPPHIPCRKTSLLSPVTVTAAPLLHHVADTTATAAAAAAAQNTTPTRFAKPAAAADGNDVPDMDDALNETMELFISGASIEPAYELRGELGRGKYGRVFLVEDCVQRRLLAVKATFDPNWIASVRHTRARAHGTATNDGGAATVNRPSNDAINRPPTPPASTHLSSEVACMRECNSPFVIRLEGAEKGEHGEDLLLMEYVDCGDLRQEIRRRRAIAHPFTETEVAFIFLQLCMAVDHVHQRNILHHDLKPENILLSSTGIIKLGDFGFARKYGEPVSNRVASTGCGTPYYLSPEALRGERYSLKSEMWALGVILYELMSLTGPFVATNRTDLRAKVHEGHYAPLPSTYSPALREVCVRLLSQSPDHRPSAHELFTDNEYLRDVLNELRRTSECSTKMTAEEKGSMFYSISAALRRRSPAAPSGVGTASNCTSWSGSLNNSYGVSSGPATSVVTQRTRIEC